MMSVKPIESVDILHYVDSFRQRASRDIIEWSYVPWCCPGLGFGTLRGWRMCPGRRCTATLARLSMDCPASMRMGNKSCSPKSKYPLTLIQVINVMQVQYTFVMYGNVDLISMWLGLDISITSKLY